MYGDKMKKYKIYLIIVVIVMLIPILIKTFTKTNSVEYKVNDYTINERFYIEEDNHKYEFKISKKKQVYSYILDENINKRKKVIKELKEFNKGNLKCIVPIYKKDIDKDIYCLENNKQVSKYSLLKNDNFKAIQEKVKKYNIELPTSSDKSKEFKKIKVYQNNISEDEAFILWSYKGINILKNDDLKYVKFLDYDLYDNIMSTTTSKYFVLFENSDVMGIENIHYYDIKKDKYKIYKLKEKISKESYINGVYNDLIYVTDKEKKIQYAVNLKKEEIDVVGKEELGYIKYVYNEKEILNKSDFFMKEQYFTNERIKDSNITKSTDLIKDKQIYYYLEDNKFYKNINGYNSIYLFNKNNIKDWNVWYDSIIINIDDAIYQYNDKKGLRKIVEYNELNYNYKNIVKYWK